MKWIVQGANPETGTELTREVEALNAEDAERDARERGMLVSRVIAAGAKSKEPPIRRPPIEISPETIEANTYSSLRAAATALQVVAVIFDLLCICSIIGIVANVDNQIVVSASGASAVFTLAVGVFFHGFSCLCHAIYYMAIRAAKNK